MRQTYRFEADSKLLTMTVAAIFTSSKDILAMNKFIGYMDS